jgi:hypothetical protein
VESSRPEAVLVVGSFPPVPTLGAAATVAAVRRELSAGRTVLTASPRPSAAALVLRLSGPLGSWNLERVRRRTGAVNVVLSLEQGWPLPPGLLLVLLRFDRVTVLVSDASASSMRVLKRLRPAVDDIVLSGEAVESDAVAMLARALPRVTLRVDDASPLAAPMSGATPFGPSDPEWQPNPSRAKERGQRVVGALRNPDRLVEYLRAEDSPVRRARGKARRAIARMR